MCVVKAGVKRLSHFSVVKGFTSPAHGYINTFLKWSLTFYSKGENEVEKYRFQWLPGRLGCSVCVWLLSGWDCASQTTDMTGSASPHQQECGVLCVHISGPSPLITHFSQSACKCWNLCSCPCVVGFLVISDKLSSLAVQEKGNEANLWIGV